MNRRIILRKNRRLVLRITYPSGQTVEYEYYNGGSLAGFSAAGQTIIDGLKYEAGGSAKFMTLHWTDDETVNWVQTLNARKWSEKNKVFPGVDGYCDVFRVWKKKYEAPVSAA